MSSLKSYLLLFLLFASVSLSLSARQAQHRNLTITQPDGTSFTAQCYGDEWMRIITTADGCSIIKDKSGWWNYAVYNSEGEKISTGYKVGDLLPSDILENSRNIPFNILADKVARKRNAIKTYNLNRSSRLRTSSNDSSTVSKTRKGLILLVEFPDVKFTYSHEDFNTILNKENYNGIGCAKDYYNDQFEGKYEFSFDICPIIQVDKFSRYYGDGDDDNAPEMIYDACVKADEYIDFSQYDYDGDGWVDNVYVFYAGKDEAEHSDMTDYIWAHQWYIYSGAKLDKLILDGVIIDRYACSSEITNDSDLTNIGTFCHEFLHTFDVPDFYDTDYTENGFAAGLWGKTSLMDSGNYNNDSKTPPYLNAIEREILGLGEMIMLERGKSYTIEPIHKSRKYYRIDTDTEREYYLLECRSNEKWDEYIGGNGLLIYHIDKTDNTHWDFTNTVNCNLSHQMADLIEADGRSDNYTSILPDISTIFFPTELNKSFTPTSNPAIKYWSGTEPDFAIIDIRREGENISFTVLGTDDISSPPVATNINCHTFTDAAIISFNSSTDYDGDAYVIWGRPGKEMREMAVKPYETGAYSFTLENLTKGNKTYKVEIYFKNDLGSGEAKSASFMTRRTPNVDWPYIELNGVERTSDGSFKKGCRLPLRIANASSAAEIIWKYDTTIIEASSDGYFKPEKDGQLTAEIFWEEGGSDIIIKEIIIEK